MHKKMRYTLITMGLLVLLIVIGDIESIIAANQQQLLITTPDHTETYNLHNNGTLTMINNGPLNCNDTTNNTLYQSTGTIYWCNGQTWTDLTQGSTDTNNYPTTLTVTNGSTHTITLGRNGLTNLLASFDDQNSGGGSITGVQSIDNYLIITNASISNFSLNTTTLAGAACAAGEVSKWNGTKFNCITDQTGTDTNSGYTQWRLAVAGQGISALTNNTLLRLISGTGISITNDTTNNITLTNTQPDTWQGNQSIYDTKINNLQTANTTLNTSITNLFTSITTLSSNAGGWTNNTNEIYLSNNATNISIGNSTGNKTTANLYIDETNNRIGIGTNKPNNKVEIIGTLNATALQVGTTPVLTTAVTSIATTQYITGGTITTTGTLSFDANGFTTANGNWSADKNSYSTTTTNNNLYLNAATQGGWKNTTTQLLLNSNTTNVTIGNATGDPATLFIDNTNSKVGIGTIKPNNELEVLGTLNATTIKVGNTNVLTTAVTNIATAQYITGGPLTTTGTISLDTAGLITIIGNWSADKPSYTTTTNGDTRWAPTSTVNSAGGWTNTTTSTSTLLNTSIGQTSAPLDFLVNAGTAQTIAQFNTSLNDWTQLNLQNTNTGNLSQAGYNIQAAGGNDTNGFAFFGCNGYNYTNTPADILHYPAGPWNCIIEQLGNSTLPGGLHITTLGAANISIETNNVVRTTFTSDGKVGIGTQTPLQTLDVAGNTNITGTTYIGNTGAKILSNSTCLLFYSPNGALGGSICN